MNRMIWRTRVRLIVNALSAVLMVLFIYAVYYSAVQIYYDKSGQNNKFIRSVMTTLNCTRVDLW
ncbi:hypothetical protein [Paenibacillus solani]|uniref:hypothetical protein n=1 Tax=Paenibacillus solani TaxID=1705565 RepID=UPI00103DA35B|nr:hypothetical protein [Paenibacillus solani]